MAAPIGTNPVVLTARCDAPCAGAEMMSTHDPQPPGKPISILYMNYRGETALRRVLPQRIWFGTTEWHPEDQWVLDAIDLEKQVERSFAMKDIKQWLWD